MKFRDLFDKETWLPNWDYIFSVEEFKVMEDCKQSSTFHKEGNVKKHTKLVTDEMLKYLKEKENITPSDNTYYITMMSAAICHDLGKPSTTKFDKKKNDYATSNHGMAGAVIARKLFFDEDYVLRENVCYMIRNHMILHHILDKKGMISRKIMALSHGRVTFKDMLILNICDSLGSINDIEGHDFLEKKVAELKERAYSLGCFDKPYRFRNDYEKVDYFASNDEDTAGIEINEDECGKFTMYVMIGVPGSGKSTFIEKYLKDVVVISRDLIRTEIGISGEKPQGNKKQEDEVTRLFNEKVMECCKEKKNFVIDNTNVKKSYRKEYTNMVKGYRPNIEYVYVEAPDLQSYYDRREGLMPLSVIDRMWSNFDFPDPTEYNNLTIYKQYKF